MTAGAYGQASAKRQVVSLTEPDVFHRARVYEAVKALSLVLPQTVNSETLKQSKLVRIRCDILEKQMKISYVGTQIPGRNPTDFLHDTQNTIIIL